MDNYPDDNYPDDNYPNTEISMKFSKRGFLSSKKNKKYLFLIILVILVLGGFLWSEIYLPKTPLNESEGVFLIKKREGLGDISSNLKSQGFIKSKILFKAYALLAGSARGLQAGKYDLSSPVNIPQMLGKFISGDIIKEKLTVFEGWTLKDIAWYFENRGMFQAEEIFEVAGFPGVDYSKAKDMSLPEDFSKNFDFLQEKPNVSLEGYLFPDTYEIKEEEGVEEILKKFLENFGKKITDDLKEEIAHQGKTLFEILTMASLLEKEVKTYEDKQIIAGILWKRLRNGWPLQVDATLTYITGKGSLELSKEDLEIDSRYNTYKYYGLPLGPICNPGLESMAAAIYYKNSPYWFYITNSKEEVIFSKTFEDHIAAKNEHLK